MNDYSNRVQIEGQIYKNDYKSNEKQPDKRGEIELSKEFLKPIVEAIKAQNGKPFTPPKVQFAVWERTSNAGNDYWWVRMEYTPLEEEEEQEQEQQDDFDDDIPF